MSIMDFSENIKALFQDYIYDWEDNGSYLIGEDEYQIDFDDWLGAREGAPHLVKRLKEIGIDVDGETAIKMAMEYFDDYNKWLHDKQVAFQEAKKNARS
jgi:hypothetical protein